MIAVIADDLSGAAELAGVACRHGLSAEVQTVFSRFSNADVICVDTDSRPLSPAKAAEKVAVVAGEIATARPAWIFKKCDSVLRGPVLAEARAIARIFDRSRIVVVPANPSRGRIIRNGNYLVNEVPLHETAFAMDPEHPRRSSRVVELLGDESSGELFPDTETMDDVLKHAAAVDEQTLPVGAADFFATLLQRREPRHAVPGSEAARDDLGATLLVCGSAAAWAERRRQAVASGVPVFARPYDITAAIQALRSTRRIIVGIGEAPETRGHLPARLADELAHIVAALLRETDVVRLLSEGGATTAAIMRAMGWTRLSVLEATRQGVAMLRPVGADGPLLCIKPGSYPWPKELWPAGVA